MILYLCSTIVFKEGELSLKSFVFEGHIIEEKRKLGSSPKQTPKIISMRHIVVFNMAKAGIPIEPFWQTDMAMGNQKGYTPKRKLGVEPERLLSSWKIHCIKPI